MTRLWQAGPCQDAMGTATFCPAAAPGQPFPRAAPLLALISTIRMLHHVPPMWLAENLCAYSEAALEGHQGWKHSGMCRMLQLLYLQTHTAKQDGKDLELTENKFRQNNSECPFISGTSGAWSCLPGWIIAAKTTEVIEETIREPEGEKGATESEWSMLG